MKLKTLLESKQSLYNLLNTDLNNVNLSYNVAQLWIELQKHYSAYDHTYSLLLEKYFAAKEWNNDLLKHENYEGFKKEIEGLIEREVEVKKMEIKLSELKNSGLKGIDLVNLNWLITK